MLAIQPWASYNSRLQKVKEKCLTFSRAVFLEIEDIASKTLKQAFRAFRLLSAERSGSLSRPVLVCQLNTQTPLLNI